MTGQAWTVNSDDKRDQFLQYAAELYDKHKYVTFEWTVGPPHRSQKQNNALHVYLRQLAMALNSAGLDMRKVLKAERAFVASYPADCNWKGFHNRADYRAIS